MNSTTLAESYEVRIIQYHILLRCRSTPTKLFIQYWTAVFSGWSGSERGVGAQKEDAGTGRPHRQEQCCREAGDQREEQEPETVGDSAPAFLQAVMLGRRGGIVSDIAPALSAREPCMAAFHKGWLSMRTAACAAVPALRAPL